MIMTDIFVEKRLKFVVKTFKKRVSKTIAVEKAIFSLLDHGIWWLADWLILTACQHV